MSAQKTIAAKPVLEVAVERMSRNRSSGSTDETDALREEINSLRAEVTSEIKEIDHIRALFMRADAVFEELPGRARLVQRLNTESQWRHRVLEDHQLGQVRIVLPQNKEVK